MMALLRFDLDEKIPYMYKDANLLYNMASRLIQIPPSPFHFSKHAKIKQLTSFKLCGVIDRSARSGIAKKESKMLITSPPYEYDK